MSSLKPSVDPSAVRSASSSGSGDRTIDLPVVASRLQITLIVAGHMAGGYALVMLLPVLSPGFSTAPHAAPWLVTSLALALLLSGHHAINLARLHAPDAIIRVRCYNGVWRLRQRNGEIHHATLASPHFAGTWFTIVRFNTEAGSRTVVLARDALPDAVYRRARVFFRFGCGEPDPA